ncbi:MAG: undecaprenyl-diphosphatase UppP [Acidobacteria bacterium]|nr:undecaprenyl-diphosphatase UppP [Acidobacteriota bacterium]
MTFVYAALLGIVQGLTEFLPVSSSAHLILARALFGWDADAFGLAFDVACHVGTLLAVVIYFWNDLWAMACALPRALEAGEDARRIRLIVVGTLPVVAVGLLFADAIENGLRSPAVTIVTLTLGAVLFLVAERVRPATRLASDITMGEALAFGCAQAAALVPGISRSGATITMGLFLGVRRAEAARFSFLLGVPAILAAALKEGLHLVEVGLSADAAPLFLVGMVTSAVVGYLTVRFFMRFLGSHRLDVFAAYRLILAAVVVVWLFAR